VILSIDTTSEFGSIALTDSGRAVAEVPLHSPDGFGHILFPQIEQLLARNGVAIGEMECFAAASGPGSFTGVRVGLAAAKGLAETTGRRVVAVSNLRALAFFGSAALRATVLDARRGEVFGAVYDDRLEIVSPEVVMRFPDWLSTLPAESFEFIATDFSPFAAHVASGVAVSTAPRALAAAVGHIAWRDFTAGRSRDPAEIDANYVRRSDAELFWKEKG